MTRRIALSALLSCSVLLTACTRDGGATRAERRRLVPSLRIGSENAGAEYMFTEIRQVVASDSEVFVLPAETPEIRVFDMQGRHRRTIGRRGSGPGEFDAVTAIGLFGDTLWTLDSNLRRVTRFSSSGELLTTSRLASMSPEVGSHGKFYFFYPMAMLKDGSPVGFGGTTGRALAAGEVVALPLLRLPSGTVAADTIGWVPIGNEHLILRSSKGIMYRAQPFADAPLTAYDPWNGRVLVVERYTARAAGDAAVRVTSLGMHGDTLWSTTLPYTARRLDARVVDSVRAHLTRVLAPRFPAGEIDRQLFVPSFRTPVTDMLAGADGSVWIGWDTPERATRFTVLAADGRVSFAVDGPQGIHLVWADGGVAWGQVFDADDVPSLVRFRIVASR